MLPRLRRQPPKSVRRGRPIGWGKVEGAAAHGGKTAGQGSAGSPGSGGASPYLSRRVSFSAVAGNAQPVLQFAVAELSDSNRTAFSDTFNPASLK